MSAIMRWYLFFIGVLIHTSQIDHNVGTDLQVGEILMISREPIKYRERLGWKESGHTIDLIKLSLSEGKPVPIHNMGLDYVSQNIEFMRDALGKVIKLAETPSDGNVKERCRVILVSSKEQLSYSRKRQVKDLFGDTVFD